MADAVKQAIRDALYAGRFRAGQPLSEGALAAEMGVSRGPVRESLFVLAQEGLVTHSPNRGFSVVEFTELDRKEVDEVRLPLETTALTLAQPRLTADDLRELSRLRDEIVRTYVEDQPIECGQFDMEFHSLVWERSGNSRLVAALRNLMAPFFAYGSLFNVRRPSLTADLLREEHDCYVRFLDGSGTWSAEACVRFHVGLNEPIDWSAPRS